MSHFIFMGRQRGHVKRWDIHTDMYDLYNLSSGLIAFSRGFCFSSFSSFLIFREKERSLHHIGRTWMSYPATRIGSETEKNGGKNTQDKDVRTHAPPCLSSSLFRSSTTETWRFRAPRGRADPRLLSSIFFLENSFKIDLN